MAISDKLSDAKLTEYGAEVDVITITQDVCNRYCEWSVTNMAAARIWDDIFNP